MTKCNWGDDVETNLRVLRKKMGLSQIALQMKTGVDQALLSQFETGKRTPPTETLMILADFYQVSMDYIMKRTEKPEINK